ncbi:MAG: hypothetical protein ACWA41_06490 [Putridiphycobacter sp.]
MKKVLLVSAFAVLALASCEKDYSCTVTVFGSEIKSDYNNLNKEEAADQKEACESVGGEWKLESL